MEGFLKGQELILRHTNTVKELPSKGLKEYAPNNSWLEERQIENQLDERLSFIDAERIEKGNNISQAEWIDDVKKAKVTKKIGKSWETFGHYSDNEDWLFPEEALFLLENCELQLFYNTIPVSIEDFYRLIFHEQVYPLVDYRVYSHLSRAGFKVVRHNPSVSATHYEKQVKLDSIMQKQRRSIPSSFEDVTVIDDDICILENPTSLKKPTKSSEKETPKGTPNDPILIEIDDELDNVNSDTEVKTTIIESDSDSDDVKAEIEVKTTTIDSDSDSDVIFISSPSLVSSENSRKWYPPIDNCLRRTMETLIDLCDEDDDIDNKRLIKTKMDLIRPSKDRILSTIPSVKSGVSVIHAPDIRLLPPNIVPKHSEYEVNLNIIADDSDIDYSNRNNFNRNFNRHNTRFRNEHPLKSMAKTMINAATKIIEFFNRADTFPDEQNTNDLSVPRLPNLFNGASVEQNPNELWDLVRVAPPHVNAFTQRYHPGSYRRPFFPRRRFPRRRMSHSRGHSYGQRMPHRFSRSESIRHDENRNISPSASAVITSNVSTPEEIVILSDDDDIKKEPDLENDKKRKQNNDNNSNKRIKTEHGDSPNDDSSSIENEPNGNLKVEKDVHDKVIKVESDTAIMEVKTELPDVEVKSELNSIAPSSPAIVKCESTSENIKTELSSKNVTNKPYAAIEPYQSTTSISGTHQASLSLASDCLSSLETKSELNPANSNLENTNTFFNESQPKDKSEKSVAENSTVPNSKQEEQSPVNQQHLLTDIQPGPSQVSEVIISEEEPKGFSKESLVTDMAKSVAETSIVPNSKQEEQSSVNQQHLLTDIQPGPSQVSEVIISEEESKGFSKESLVTDMAKSVAENSIVPNSKQEEQSSVNQQHLLTDIQPGPSQVSNIKIKEKKSNEQLNKADEENKHIMTPAITTWEEYKNRSDDFDSDSDIGDPNALIKYGQCSTYGDVLSALQIFQKIDVKKISRQFKICFDVYLPESNFKKSLKVLPNYRVIVMMPEEELPSSLELKSLKMQYQDDIPFLFSVVFDETVTFYLCDTVNINTLYD